MKSNDMTSFQTLRRARSLSVSPSLYLSRFLPFDELFNRNIYLVYTYIQHQRLTVPLDNALVSIAKALTQMNGCF